MSQSYGDTKPANVEGVLERRLWWLVCAVVIGYLILLVVETFLRIRFPWDLWRWPESPFMVDMLKLNNHLPVYSPPADANSFVYSPGLEYLTYVVLKPFGLVLDVRYCRLVSVFIGMLAAFAGTLPIMRLFRATVPTAKTGWPFFITWGFLWLVISSSIVSDVSHPDNLHILHAAAAFGLCFATIETKSFGMGLLTMVFAALGIFTKQTEAACFMGVAVIFAVYNPWGLKRLLLLLLIGGVMTAASLYIFWLPQYARYFTFELLRHQKVDIAKIGPMVGELLSRQHVLILFPAVIAFFYFWLAGGVYRRFLICWLMIGGCCASANMLAYVKISGLSNNLIIFKVWKALLAWPLFLIFIKGRSPTVKDTSHPDRWPVAANPLAFYTILIFFVIALWPVKTRPSPGLVTCCQAVDAAVAKDFQSGRKVLVSHGTCFLIHAGSREVPRDQANAVLEINEAGQQKVFDDMRARIKSHYYDHIYLMTEEWYGEELLADIDHDYFVESTIPRGNNHEGTVMTDCKILAPRH